MNAKNIQEYVINYVIQYLDDKDKIIEEQRKKLIEQAKLISYFKKNCLVCKCHNCGNDIYIDLNQETHLLYVEQKFRKCSVIGCKFIICGLCAGDFIDPITFDCTGVYVWRGNPWLGVHPRPIEDDDYVCGEECCPARH